jgi:hypothetical protein
VQQCAYSRAYAYSWYLDAMTNGQWSALVDSDEYSVIIPILYKKKYLLPYVVQPFLCQQLDIYMQEVDDAIIIKVMDHLRRSCIKVDLAFSKKHTFVKGKTITKQNHRLDIGKEYANVRANYHRNTKRNILFAEESNVSISSHLDGNRFLEFMSDHDVTGLVKLHSSKIAALLVTTSALKNDSLIACYNGEELVSVAYFVYDRDTIYFLLCASNDTGKELRVMYLIIDHIIKINAGKYKIFDFTGSNIESIARRNEGFGAQVEKYYQWSWTML